MLCVIGGSGLNRLEGLTPDGQGIDTPYGAASAELQYGEIDGHPLAFLPRHGVGHKIPPHRINYRANIHRIRTAGIQQILSVAAVGSLKPEWTGGELILPDQLIDYTWGRASCFADEQLLENSHYDFTAPFCDSMRRSVVHAAAAAGVTVHDGATYGVTQGPRLETAAEIRRMARDGCHLVGMTAMPEAGLAREAGLCFASLAVVANPAAGIGDAASLTMEQIHKTLGQA